MAFSMLADMSVWERFWAFPFYQHALLGAVPIALTCSVLSVFVILRRMTFIGHGISHSAFGGAGLALLLTLVMPAMRSPLARDALIVVFCVLSSLLIGRLGRQRHVHEDSAIGICLVGAMALGLMLIDVRTIWFEQLRTAGRLDYLTLGYTPPLHSLLFGDVLSIPPDELPVVWGVCMAIFIAVMAVYRELVFFAFDQEGARAFGVRTSLLYYGLLVAVAISIVAAMRFLGVILGSALLVLPGASANLWSRRIGRVTVLAIVFGFCGVIGGIFLAIWLQGLSTGPVIVLVLCLWFAVSFAWASVRRPS
jgi:ABC-type Mn2+/Zn2+ transport system permease subunit